MGRWIVVGLFGATWIFATGAQAMTTATVSAQSTSYVRSSTPYFRKDLNASQMSILGMEFQSHSKPVSKTDMFVDGAGFYSVAEGEAFLNLREAYLVRRWSSSRFTLGVGRKKTPWSFDDEVWQEGHWQPRFQWDGLRPESQGLTGLHLESDHFKDQHYVLFVSPIFLPNTGVSVREERGSLLSENPWFQTPRSSFEFQGAPTDIRYSLVKPDVNAIVFQPGVALMGRWQMDHHQLQAAYAYKPQNPLMLAAPVRLRTYSSGETEIEVPIHPRSVYHHLATLEHSFTKGPLKTVTSLTYDNPLVSELPEDWLAQSIGRTFAVGGHGLWDWGRWSSYLGARYVFGGDQKDKGQFALDESYFGRRYRWVEAWRAGLQLNTLYFKGLQVSGFMEATYDVAQNAGWYSVQCSVKPSVPWTFSLQADVLGIVDETPVAMNDGFLRTYRANDRISLGMSYVY
ncbi:MAG: hypothetical protein H6626_02645 [Pseudobdellovibrionaceae bacterium]|nr:hypothetical protein [Bdellovibrionales bacterium]USN48005.1 MAG: hypothetical protein H6626_02645 [Pseudobdellovibrionaceae bacterium]